jgi:hypothetical protein
MRKMIIGALVGALLATAAVALADHDLNRKRPPRLRLMHHGDVLQRVSA